MFRTNGWPNANMIHATQNCELANAYYLVCLFHASSISWMFNCLSCTLTPSDKVKRNLLKMRTASLWCHNDHVKKENKPILLHIWKKHCPITRWSSFSTTNHDAMVKFPPPKGQHDGKILHHPQFTYSESLLSRSGRSFLTSRDPERDLLLETCVCLFLYL